ncbi:MAG TPA: IS982 family transposase, partial [Acidimicrobiales bacterium]|nr:IS982 family transposase [Acidimicrobiales bacterium]
MNAALDALATELYVTVDDLLMDHPHLAPSRPPVGIAPQFSDAELVTLAVLQALLGYHNEARFIRYAHTHLRHLFPYLPQRPAYNKRLRRSVALLHGVC